MSNGQNTRQEVKDGSNSDLRWKLDYNVVIHRYGLQRFREPEGSFAIYPIIANIQLTVDVKLPVSMMKQKKVQYCSIHYSLGSEFRELSDQPCLYIQHFQLIQLIRENQKKKKKKKIK